MSAAIRVELPAALCRLAGCGATLTVRVAGEVTLAALLDAIERAQPALHGTIRDPATQRRRPFIRFFACERDYSAMAPDAPLPAEVVSGAEPLLVVGAIAGG